MYPQTVVPLGELHNILTANYAAQTNNVKATGASYTANKDDLKWDPATGDQELNYEYSYNGDRYVKVTPYARYVDDTYKYNVTADNPNPERIGQGGVRWFKVEPIKWIILNINIFEDKNVVNGIVTNLGSVSAPLELYAANVLMGGIAPNQGLWQHASNRMYQYLNEVFYKEAFPMTYIPESKIYNNTGLSDYDNPAYNLNSNYNSIISGGTGYNPTDQRIYMLSRYELENADSPYVNADYNPIFTTDEYRKVSGTDYARAHNLGLYSSGAYYWIRSANSSSSVYLVIYSGGISNATANNAAHGTRPASTMAVLLYEAIIFQSSL